MPSNTATNTNVSADSDVLWKTFGVVPLTASHTLPLLGRGRTDQCEGCMPLWRMTPLAANHSLDTTHLAFNQGAILVNPNANVLISGTTVASGDELPMNFVPFRALFLANFGEFLFHAIG
jgi:hypothetical protein